MTKSQNTKNEQQKDLCITSEHLSEQWKKGELPSGEYYIIDDLGLHTTDRYYPSHGFGAELPQAVLAPVPSYDEWKAKLEENAQLKKQINHLLKTQARQFVDNQKLQVKAEKAKDVVNIDTARQIKQLKELLKECKQWFDWYHIDTGTGKEYIESWHKKGYEIHKKIDEVLQ